MHTRTGNEAGPTNNTSILVALVVWFKPYDDLVTGSDKRLTNMRLELTTAFQSELIDIMIYIKQALRTVSWRRLIIINTSEILSYKSPAYT